MGHFWDMDKNSGWPGEDPKSFPHMPAHNCRKSADCLNICLNNNRCTKTKEIVYDDCPFYKRKRKGEYPQKGDIFLLGNNWKPGKKEGQVSQQIYIDDTDDKLYFAICEKKNIPNKFEKLGIKGYDDGYFRITKKLDKVVFVKWVCGR